MKKSLCIIFLFIGISLSAQDISLKTNLLYDISTTFNLGAEFRLAPKWTLDVSANYNPFTFSDSKKWKHWMAQPEARYWLCEAFNGHFFGLHLLGGQFNVGNVKFLWAFILLPRTIGMRDIITAQACPTAISGYWATAGAWKRASV